MRASAVILCMKQFFFTVLYCLYQNLQQKSYQEDILYAGHLENAIDRVNKQNLTDAVHKYYTNSDNKDRIVTCDALVRETCN